MGDVLIQVTVLVLVILAVRKLFGERLHVYVRYGLWILVVMRLLIPVNPVESAMSLLNVVNAVRPEQNGNAGIEGTESKGTESEGTEREAVRSEAVRSEAVRSGAAEREAAGKTVGNGETRISAAKGEQTKIQMDENRQGAGFRIIWIGGSILTGCALGIPYFFFRRRLQKTRRSAKYRKCPIPVYTVKHLESPCLIGLFVPTIYINTDLEEHTEKLRYALTHEWVHYLHKDYVWAAVRTVLVIVYWFHPFVWAAAIASAKDGELACDYKTVRLLGEEERFAYGEMLLELSGKKSRKSLYSYGTLLRPGKAEMKERISRLMDGRKSKKTVSAAVIVLMFALTGCAFTGAESNTETENTTSKGAEVQLQPEEEKEKAKLEELENQQEKIEEQQEKIEEQQEKIEELQKRAGEEAVVQCEPQAAELSIDTPLGVDGPVLDYAGEFGSTGSAVIIFHDYFGLVVFDLNNGKIINSLNLEAIGCNMTQGDDTCQVAVSKDGTTVWLHPMSKNYMYRYETEENELYRELLVKGFEVDLETKELFTNYADKEDYIDEWIGDRSNYLYREYTYKGETYRERIYLYASNEEEQCLRNLQCVWDDMVYVLFQQENFPYSYDGAVKEVELIYDVPCDFIRISAGFGNRFHPETGEKTAHLGIDFAAEEGTDITAAAAGMVYETGYDSYYGNYVVLLHINGDFTYYCQCKEVTVEKDEQVKQGEKIAAVGKTGAATGAQLHFALSQGGEFVDPMEYMAGKLPLDE